MPGGSKCDEVSFLTDDDIINAKSKREKMSRIEKGKKMNHSLTAATTVLGLALVGTGTEAFTAKLNPPGSFQGTHRGKNSYSGDLRLVLYVDGEIKKKKKVSHRASAGETPEGDPETEDTSSEDSFSSSSISASGPLARGSRSNFNAGLSATELLSLRRAPESIKINGEDTPTKFVPHQQSPSLSSYVPPPRYPSLKKHMRSLIKMCRPSNFHGVILVNALGVFRALTDLSTAAAGGAVAPHNANFWGMVTRPSMLSLFMSVVLVSASSMVVNDMFDARIGVDGPDSKKNLVANGVVPIEVARLFRNYLYAALLLCNTFVPGWPARLAVVAGVILTYAYTEFLKPLTWWKNIACAGLIAVSPLASCSATYHILGPLGRSTSEIGNALFSTWRTVLTLFTVFMGREIVMDITDTELDAGIGVRTVPVVYGKRFASYTALALTIISSVFAASGPAIRLVLASTMMEGNVLGILGSLLKMTDARRLLFAVVGGFLTVRSVGRVASTGGEDNVEADRAIQGGLLSLALVLGSFF